MPILDFSFSVGSGEDVASLEVVIFRAPEYVRKGSFGLVCDGKSKALLFHIEHLYCSILASCIKSDIPAARYLSWVSNLTE